jgi:hypothetical protein
LEGSPLLHGDWRTVVAHHRHHQAHRVWSGYHQLHRVRWDTTKQAVPTATTKHTVSTATTKHTGSTATTKHTIHSTPRHHCEQPGGHTAGALGMWLSVLDVYREWGMGKRTF